MYLRPRLIPLLLLKGEGLVKTIKFAEPRYIGDPINTVKLFNGKGVDELCLLDITASMEGRGPNFPVLEGIASEAFMPMSYGGGITDIEQMAKIFSMGYEKIVINTAAAYIPNLIEQGAKRFGSQSVVVSLDVREDFLGRRVCVVKSGHEKIKGSPLDIARRAQDYGAGELILGNVSRDGTMSGYDLEFIGSIAHALTIPVIAAHGAAGTEDLKRALDAGASAAAAGSIYVYYGKHKAVLINAPEEKKLLEMGVYKDD
jgi:imidazole glycerol-phosphate synthase subunit HisF